MLNKKKDGSVLWVNSTIVPMLDGEGRPYRYFTYKVDITVLKNVQPVTMGLNVFILVDQYN
ncbi:hypothetical protein JMA_10770 [Jeotgalibacillus malaysiensis]|uniref:PAC domain-containing protein n=1 Tax=Jeotgalibacillus malaysiensis TaxID=1508404 RepID=A0A0B5AQP9_9BACL|nr:hypothetical protein [Jeotgalibacillus malaysiensis]AJD90394.1 hypothetical protein JMA_10770 [Jeotgalibacillus malaysiensis]